MIISEVLAFACQKRILQKMKLVKNSLSSSMIAAGLSYTIKKQRKEITQFPKQSLTEKSLRKGNKNKETPEYSKWSDVNSHNVNINKLLIFSCNYFPQVGWQLLRNSLSYPIIIDLQVALQMHEGKDRILLNSGF